MIKNHLAGLAGEDSVTRFYERLGHRICETRWRGAAGEIDLIAEGPDGLVFIEVKKSKSFDRAAYRVSARQQARIFDTATEFLGVTGRGLDAQSRFDVALVDSVGQVNVIENAFGQV